MLICFAEVLLGFTWIQSVKPKNFQTASKHLYAKSLKYLKIINLLKKKKVIYKKNFIFFPNCMEYINLCNKYNIKLI